jgi:dTMP kinase
VTGNTLLQAEVADELRGRTFALVQSLVRIDLLLVLAVAPALVGLIGSHSVHLWGDVNVRADGVTFVLLGGGVLAIVVGLFAYRQMDDHSGVPVLPELWNALRGRRQGRRPRHTGLLVAIEGADAAARTEQLEALRSWLAETGREVMVASDAVIAAPLEAALRQLQADPSAALHPRTEALLAAAVRAEHVARVIEPALARGAVVLTDHYVDSTVAHQSAASCAGLDELTVLAQWATMSLLPDVTVLLDTETDTETDAETSGAGAPVLTFDEEVRAAFLRLADEEPHRYLVLDRAAPADELRARIRQAVTRRLGGAANGVASEPADPAMDVAALGSARFPEGSA